MKIKLGVPDSNPKGVPREKRSVAAVGREGPGRKRWGLVGLESWQV